MLVSCDRTAVGRLRMRGLCRLGMAGGDLAAVQSGLAHRVSLKQRRGTGGWAGIWRPCRCRKLEYQPGLARIWP